MSAIDWSQGNDSARKQQPPGPQEGRHQICTTQRQFFFWLSIWFSPRDPLSSAGVWLSGTHSSQFSSHWASLDRYFMSLISFSFCTQHFIIYWLLHCSGQTELLLSALCWTWTLISSLFSGVLLGQCNESNLSIWEAAESGRTQAWLLWKKIF